MAIRKLVVSYVGLDGKSVSVSPADGEPVILTRLCAQPVQLYLMAAKEAALNSVFRDNSWRRAGHQMDSWQLGLRKETPRWKRKYKISDDTNAVLKVGGIRFDLLEVSSGVLIDTQNSKDLNPPLTGSSNEWGVKLSFTAKAGPLEVYTTDPNYRYPGNTIQSLEGQNDNRIDIDLLKVPVTTGGQGTILTTSNPTAIAAIGKIWLALGELGKARGPQLGLKLPAIKGFSGAGIKERCI